ncbi:hypothetical protein DSM112329_00620 [Paraconexibacter sp. AEG42_29]|uniref:N-acetyltransferase domain-containing protein n=1 Tax=Paraconexibacter sp. AEG42_29 TaxID=2997339 RepID=A0AAU7AQ94_9ACTN
MTARTVLAGPDGVACATYVRGTRDGLPLADRLRPRDGAAPHVVAAAAVDTFPGWLVAVHPGPLGDALLAAGATLRRHAHVMRLDLARVPPRPPAPAPPGVTVAALDPRELPAGLGEPNLAAYPAGHPDARPGETAASALAELQRIADGLVTGPLHPATRMAIGADASPLGAVFVNDRPASGPWITDIFRRPGPATRGLGSLLLDHAVAAVRDVGGIQVGLAVTDGNPAQTLYVDRGFVVLESALTLLLPG